MVVSVATVRASPTSVHTTSTAWFVTAGGCTVRALDAGADTCRRNLGGALSRLSDAMHVTRAAGHQPTVTCSNRILFHAQFSLHSTFLRTLLYWILGCWRVCRRKIHAVGPDGASPAQNPAPLEGQLQLIRNRPVIAVNDVGPSRTVLKGSGQHHPLPRYYFMLDRKTLGLGTQMCFCLY